MQGIWRVSGFLWAHSRSEEGLVRGGLLWIQRHLWLALDLWAKEPKKEIKKNSFQVYLEGSRAQICWMLGPKIGPLCSLVITSAVLVFLLLNLLCQPFHFTYQEIWAQTVLSCAFVSLGNQRMLLFLIPKFPGQ